MVWWRRASPPALRWLSFEPALGTLTDDDLDILAKCFDWIIWGGESGGHARAIDLDTLRQLCAWRADGIIPPLFIKQFGERHARAQHWKSAHGADPSEWPQWARIQEFPVPRAA